MNYDDEKNKNPNQDIINQYNNHNINQNAIDNSNENNNAPNWNQNIKIKKNRTLQFYKFLFYSIKMEIKATEFIDLIRFANQSEITIWIISIVLHEKGYSGFIWFHVIHLIRGLIGFFLLLKFPKSGDIIDQMALNKQDIENYIFNDLARKAVKIRIAEPFMSMKPLLIIYMLLTILNFCIDALDFFYQLSKFDQTTETLNGKVYIFINFLIATLFISIDFCYMFWGYTLSYTFPKHIMIPIYDLIGGWVDKFKMTFKLNKTPIDLKNEESNNQSEQKNRDEVRIDLNRVDNNNNISNSKTNFENNFSKIVPISEINDNKNREQTNPENTKYQRAFNKY